MSAAQSSAAADSDTSHVGRDEQLRRPPPPRFADVVGIICSTLPAEHVLKAVRLTCKEALLAHDEARPTKILANKVPTGPEGAAELARFCRRLPRGGPHNLAVTTLTASELPEGHL